MTAVYKLLHQSLRESGISRYEYSASLVDCVDVNKITSKDFIAQFDNDTLTIDFQRTRNSEDDDGDKKRKRFYRHDEIDIVGACLFSRTMKWQFIFAKAEHFQKHKKYRDRYANGLKINKEYWVNDLSKLL